MKLEKPIENSFTDTVLYQSGGDCTENSEWWTFAESVLPHGVDRQLQRDREILARADAAIERKLSKGKRGNVVWASSLQDRLNGMNHREAARVSGMSRGAVRRMRKKSSFESVRLGGKPLPK